MPNGVANTTLIEAENGSGWSFNKSYQGLPYANQHHVWYQLGLSAGP